MSGGTPLQYIHLPALFELKLAAGRERDESDVIELLRVNPESATAIRERLVPIHKQYVDEFDRLLTRAREEEER